MWFKVRSDKNHDLWGSDHQEEDTEELELDEEDTERLLSACGVLRGMAEDTGLSTGRASGACREAASEALLGCQDATRAVVEYVVEAIRLTRASGTELAVEEMWSQLAARVGDEARDEDVVFDAGGHLTGTRGYAYVCCLDRAVRSVFFAMQFGLCDEPLDAIGAVLERSITEMRAEFRGQVFLFPERPCGGRMMELLRRWPERRGIRQVCVAYAQTALVNLSVFIDRIKADTGALSFYDDALAAARRGAVESQVKLVVRTPDDAGVLIGVVAAALDQPCGALKKACFVDHLEMHVVSVAVAHGMAAEAAAGLLPRLSHARRRMLATMLLFECMDGRDRAQALDLIEAFGAASFRFLPCRGPWSQVPDTGTDPVPGRRSRPGAKRPRTRAAAASEAARRTALWSSELTPGVPSHDQMDALRTTAAPLVRLVAMRWKEVLAALVGGSHEALGCVLQAAESLGESHQDWVRAELRRAPG